MLIRVKGNGGWWIGLRQGEHEYKYNPETGLYELCLNRGYQINCMKTYKLETNYNPQAAVPGWAMVAFIILASAILKLIML